MVEAASRTVGAMLDRALTPIVVYESTVYPGVTEEMCGPILEQVSGLVRGRDFFLGYSPERINPGDREHTVDRIVKIVAGENAQVTAELTRIYSAVTSAGTFEAASIKTAEAAKVIENAQRDINIAFMNEITQIFARMDISIWNVLGAARTKWNFLPFQPGLVGGHCIGVDPYYLSYRARELGYEPQVILAGRSTNDTMANWIADELHTRRGAKAGSVLIMGLTFKEDVPDLRNSKVVDLLRRFEWLGHDVTVHDPLAEHDEAIHEYGIAPDANAFGRQYDLVVVAVAHEAYRVLDGAALDALLATGGLLADPKNIFAGVATRNDIGRWSL
jgi:UDP-N-acetyl-D-galactosamine dehydrogenase